MKRNDILRVIFLQVRKNRENMHFIENLLFCHFKAIKAEYRYLATFHNKLFDLSCKYVNLERNRCENNYFSPFLVLLPLSSRFSNDGTRRASVVPGYDLLTVG